MKELETGEVIITQDSLQKRIAEIGKSIAEDYRGKNPVLICVLKGAVVFMADLMRAIPIPVAIDFLSISSYGAGRGEAGAVRIIKDLDINISEREVLVIEDIIDTGFTLGYLLRILKARNPASLKVAVLLDRPALRIVDLPVEYKGFEIPDEFVVGYGLDYKENFRHLPYICKLRTA
ncbi:MAG: hypoxanthine phosphoribosyltransferase [Nitrospirae bacterium]|nr:hypoxanthine phosphoribosyltransferase [Nitrospirota bacterium]